MQEQPEPIRPRGKLTFIYGIVLGCIAAGAALFSLFCLFIIIVLKMSPITTSRMQVPIIYVALFIAGPAALLAILFFFPAQAQLRLARKLRGNP